MNTAKLAALEEIRLKDPEGKLRPEAIVETAKDPEHVLHNDFTWDEAKAAYERRLNQARALIRVAVTVISDDKEPVRTYVSLTSDRQKGGGGYRLTKEVFSDEQLKKQLMEDALNELRAFRRKYARLSELGSLWAEIDRLTTKDANGGEEAA